MMNFEKFSILDFVFLIHPKAATPVVV